MPTKLRTVWTDSETHDLIRRYESGQTGAQIAAAMGKTLSQVNNRIFKVRKEFNEVVAPKAHTPESDDQIWTWYLAGKTEKAIALATGLRVSQVANRLYLLRQQRPERPEREAPDRHDPVIAARYADGVKVREIAAELGEKHHFVAWRLRVFRKTVDDMPPKRKEQVRISAFEVNIIRILLESGMVQREIADKFGCSREFIAAVSTKRLRADVPDYLEILKNSPAENAVQD